MLLVAATLVTAIALIHSYLGEKYILMRLFRQPLPKLFGDDTLTRQALRFVWHLLSVTWLGLAAVLVLLHLDDASRSKLLIVIAATFTATALTAFIASRAKHLSWIVFGAIAALCYIAV